MKITDFFSDGLAADGHRRRVIMLVSGGRGRLYTASYTLNNKTDIETSELVAEVTNK